MAAATDLAANTLTKVECAHCGLPAPAPVAAENGAEPSELSFCCRGCRGAYDLIRGWGLEEYYELRDAPSSDGQVDEDHTHRYRDLDDPSLLGRSAPMPVEASDEKLFRSKLSIAGLHCVACVWLIERACERIDGWHSSLVNMHTRTVDVVFNPQRVRLSEIATILHRVGYQVAPVRDSDLQARGLDDNQKMLIDIAVAGFCAANAMWVAIALYAGEFTGIAAGHANVLRIAGVVLGSLAVVFPGRVFFRSAWASWTTRTPHMDLPVAIGLSAGLAASVYGLFDLSSNVYFDSIACLVFFLLVGRWIQARQQRRAGEAVADLVRLAPSIATRIGSDGKPERVAVSTLIVGDLVRVPPGESVPIDGVVCEGTSSIDRSLLTGESVPIDVVEGSVIEAGTENLQATITLRATSAPEDTRFAKLTQAVSQAAQSRTPVVQLANRIGGWFVLIVLTLALITAVIWSFRDPSQVVSNVVSLLIVACPCALALATPLAIAVAIGRLARRKILIREGDCLERISRPGTIYFDKTGTLTRGSVSVTDWFGSDEALRMAASVERSIRHPIASSVCELADSKQLSIETCADATQTVGQGVSGTVSGVSICVGGLRLLEEDGVTIDAAMRNHIETIVANGSSPILVVEDAQVVAVFGIADEVRLESRDVIEFFHSRGWKVGILSGDHQSTVHRVAEKLGLPKESTRGDLLPHEKLDTIVQTAERPVIMVGDGVNDAAALAAADVGIAIHGGAAASLNAAPVMIGDGQIAKVTKLVEAATQTRRSIRRNFAISISYNVFAVALAMTGSISPLVAAVLMPVSSVSVLALTLSHRTFTEPKA